MCCKNKSEHEQIYRSLEMQLKRMLTQCSWSNTPWANARRILISFLLKSPSGPHSRVGHGDHDLVETGPDIESLSLSLASIDICRHQYPTGPIAPWAPWAPGAWIRTIRRLDEAQLFWWGTLPWAELQGGQVDMCSHLQFNICCGIFVVVNMPH